MKEAQQNYQSYQGVWVGKSVGLNTIYHTSFYQDDSGSNGVSFICNNGTDLLAGPDTVWRPDNVWTSFVSCPGNYLTPAVIFSSNMFSRQLSYLRL